jgi:biotin carboxylase
MKKTLLIIEKNPSGSIGLRKAKELGLFVIFIGSTKYYNRISGDDYKYIDRFVEMDTNDDDAVLAVVDQLAEEYRIDGVMTFMEFYVPLAARAAHRLGLPGITPESAMQARNKYLMRTRLAEAGVPGARFRSVRSFQEARDFADLVGYPNVIKPINMAGSRGVIRNDNVEDLRRHFEIVREFVPPFGVGKENLYLTEEFLDGPEYSVEAVSFQGDVNIAAITKKVLAGGNYFVEIGHVMPADIDPDLERQIKDLACQAIAALGIVNGGIHTEMKITSKGPRIVEVAARLGGDSIPELVELAVGVDLWRDVICVAVGEKPQPVKRKTGCFAAVRFLASAAPGTIARIERATDLSRNREVHSVVVQAKVGQAVRSLTNSGDRLGYAIATGDTALQAEHNSVLAAESVQFELAEPVAACVDQ